MRWLLATILMMLSGCAVMRPHAHAHAQSAATASDAAVRSFTGWAAINGGGAHARATNDDWHVQNDLHASIGGGRVPLHWRDGALSGYSLELTTVNYAERKLVVLQLSVIEDADGKAITYVWADSRAESIGLNLGWLQVGLQLTATPAASK